MKLLSLWEPWATLMAVGAKRIETRSWGTRYRGWLAIQASKGGLSKTELRTVCSDPTFRKALGWQHSMLPLSALTAHFPHGKIVAVCKLIHCIDTSAIRTVVTPFSEEEKEFGDYSPERFGWITDDLFRLPNPIPFTAKQGLCDVPEAIVLEIQEQFKGTRKPGVDVTPTLTGLTASMKPAASASAEVHPSEERATRP